MAHVLPERSEPESLLDGCFDGSVPMQYVLKNDYHIPEQVIAELASASPTR